MLLRVCSPLRKAQLSRHVQSNRPRLLKATALCGFGGVMGFSYGRYQLTPFDYPEMLMRTLRLGWAVAFMNVFFNCFIFCLSKKLSIFSVHDFGNHS